MGLVRKRLRPRLIVVYLLVLVLVAMAKPAATGLIVGGILMVLGESLRVWATGYLCKNDDLTVAGPYAFLRHPLYLGTLLIGCGFAITASNWIALMLLAVFVAGYFGYYMPYKERIESARLEDIYGEPYRLYAVAVPKLLPRLRPYTALGATRGTSTGWQWERFVDNNELGTGVVVGLCLLVMAVRWSLS